MVTFPHLPHPSAHAARQLHPAASPQPGVPADVLVEIAAGLARTVPAGPPAAGRTVLLTTDGYEAAVEAVEADGCQLVEAHDAPVGVAVVSGRLMAWTAAEGSELLSPGGLCSLSPGARLQLVNLSSERAVLVSVRARTGDEAADASAFSPCSTLVSS